MNNYEVLGVIGTGSHGPVKKVRRKSDGRVFVWKEIHYGHMTDREKQQLVTEVSILRELKNSYIVQYYDRIIDKPNSKIYLVMEFCEGGDLEKVIKRKKRDKELFSEEQIWKLLTQLAAALSECHTRKAGKILHRDIKPGNVFLDASQNVKLGDFGLSKMMETDFASTQVGTPCYMSPEQVNEGRYNEKSDIWSTGCLLYEMAALTPPFEASSQMNLAGKISAGKFDRIPSQFSEELHRVITWMLTPDPKARPDSSELFNIPRISTILREKRIRETASVLRKKEEEVRTLKTEIGQLEEEVKALKLLHASQERVEASLASAPATAHEERVADLSVVEVSMLDRTYKKSEAHRSVSPLLRPAKTQHKVVNRFGSLEMENKENVRVSDPHKSGGWLLTGSKQVPRLILSKLNK